MTDLTVTISSLLVDVHKSEPLPAVISFTTLDSFLTEARQINRSIRELLRYIRAVRTPYLSTAPPPRKAQSHARTPSHAKTTLGEIPTYLTDDQRKDISTQTTALVSDLQGSITNLRQACEIRHETARKRIQKKYGKSINFLLQWAAGGADADVGDAGKPEERIAEEGREWTTHTFRSEVLIYLDESLGRTADTQREMIEKRAEREREKAASTLYDTRNRNVKPQSSLDNDDSLANSTFDMRAKDKYNPALDASGDDGAQELSAEQLQLFEEENDSLMKHYNETLAQVTQTEESLIEIMSLQQTINSNLTMQNEMIGGLVADAERTDENVQRGNKELKRATERTSTARIMYHATLWICTTLVVWDLIF